MADPFKQKEKSIERAETITGLAREVLNKKKKPVKFTWKGFANLASGFLETNPFDKLKTDRIKELQEQDQMGIDRERIESRGGVTAGPA